MNEMLYLSRSFVEFGPFTSTELASLEARGALKETDYVRAEASNDWIHVSDWFATAETVVPEEPAPVIPSEPAPATSVVAPKAKKAAPKAKAAPEKKAPVAKKPGKKSA